MGEFVPNRAFLESIRRASARVAYRGATMPHMISPMQYTREMVQEEFGQAAADAWSALVAARAAFFRAVEE